MPFMPVKGRFSRRTGAPPLLIFEESLWESAEFSEVDPQLDIRHSLSTRLNPWWLRGVG